MPQVGIINPNEFQPLNSIELVVWVALGGRGTLYGAALGAAIVNYAKSTLTAVLPEVWLFVLGALFVLVTIVLPKGFVGLVDRFRFRRAATCVRRSVAAERRHRRRRRSATPLGGIVAPHNWILYLDKISVSFDGFRALNNLNLYIERGELRCVIGPNGAGKTTMMDVITGKTRPDEGEAFFAGSVDLLAHDEPEIASWIGRKFQKPTVFVNHTVLENLELAGHARQTRLVVTRSSRRRPKRSDRIDATLRTIGLVEHAHRPAGALSHGQKQWLEIGMLLHAEAASAARRRARRRHDETGRPRRRPSS